MRRYHAIFLDAGFTILRFARPCEDMILRVTRSFGLSFSPEQVRRADRQSQLFFEAHYYRPNDTWADDSAILQFWKDYFRLGLEALGCPQAFVMPCAEALATSLNRPETWKPYPEVPRVLAGLKEAGYTVGILSDWSSSLPSIVEALGLRTYSDFTVVSAIEGVAKPWPRFFQLALERAQVTPDRALMVGDNLYADIRGAAGVGIRGILMDRHRRGAPPGIPTICRLDELWTHLE